MVGYGESLAVILSSEDDQGNFREAVWTVSSPSEPQVHTSKCGQGLVHGPNYQQAGLNATYLELTFLLI